MWLHSLKKYILSKHRIKEHGFLNKINERALLQCEECKFSFNYESLLAKHMYRKHDSLVPKPNLGCKLSGYTFSIKKVLTKHMHKEHNGAARVQKSCNMCLFTSHLSWVLQKHIDRKQLGTLKTFECNMCDFSAKHKNSNVWTMQLQNIQSFKAEESYASFVSSRLPMKSM